MRQGFLNHVHNFRAFAIICIVAAHSLPALNWTDNESVMRVIDVFVNQSSIFFFFIAGYLFHYLLPKFTYKRYYRGKLTNVIVPYLLLSIPAIYFYTVISPRTDMYAGFYDSPLWFQVFFFYITGKQLAPLWFVPTITLFYIASPLFIWGNRTKIIYYLLPLMLAFASYWGRSGPLGPIDKAIYLLPAYVFGMFCSAYSERVMEMIRRYYWLPLGGAIALYWLLFIRVEQPPYLQIIMKILLAPVFLLALDRADSLFKDRLDYVAHASFGIFFVHAYILGVLRLGSGFLSGGGIRGGLDQPIADGSFLTTALLTGLVTILSLVMIKAVQIGAGRRSRMLIGA
jgi:surface polysaccharide O-acyltransferase-like enzyme